MTRRDDVRRAIAVEVRDFEVVDHAVVHGILAGLDQMAIADVAQHIEAVTFAGGNDIIEAVAVEIAYRDRAVELVGGPNWLRAHLGEPAGAITGKNLGRARARKPITGSPRPTDDDDIRVVVGGELTRCDVADVAAV